MYVEFTIIAMIFIIAAIILLVCLMETSDDTSADLTFRTDRETTIRIDDVKTPKKNSIIDNKSTEELRVDIENELRADGTILKDE